MTDPADVRIQSHPALRLMALTDVLHFVILPLMLFWAIRGVWEQHVQLTRWRPTWAVAVQFVNEVRPAALRYEVDGRQHKHWPKRVDNYHRAARRMVPTPNGGQDLEIEILYDPADPGQALVGRFYRFGPYFFLGMSSLFVAAFTPLAPALLADVAGGPRDAGSRGRSVVDAIVAVVATAIGGAGLLHFFSHASPPYDGGAVGWTVVYVVLGLAIAAWLISRATKWPHEAAGLRMMDR